MPSRARRLLLALAALVALASRAPAAPTVLRTTGEVSPLGWPYSLFAEGLLDRSGRTVFVASSTAVFVRTDALHQRLGAGAVLPDGRQVVNVGPPTLADDGCIVARTAFRTGGQAIVRACGTTFTPIVDGGTALAGGGVIRAFDADLAVGGTDVVGCVATLTDGTSVVVRRDGGGLTEVARSGSPAPTGGTFASFRVLGVPASGNVGFRATASDGPDGLFSGRPGGVIPIAVTGDGSPGGGTYTDIGAGTVNAGDRWAFRASLSTGEGAIFTADASQADPRLDLLVRQGATTPLDGATIRGFASSIAPSINASGAVAFRALLDNGPDGAGSASFVAAPNGALTTLVRTRLDVGGMHLINRLRDPVLADDGSAVVPVGVLGQGPVLFVASGGGALASLARLGDPTDADTGDSRFRFSAPSVRATAAGAVMLGQRDAIFRAESDGSVHALAYAGSPTPLGGRFAMLGSPVVDGRGAIFFGADVQDASANEGLFVTSGTGLATFLSPERRLLGGGGIRELFPTSVDTLAHPAAAAKGVVLAVALQGARSSEAVFAFRTKAQAAVVARSGGSAGGQRLAAFGTPATGRGGAVAMLADLGRNTRRTGLLLRRGGALGVVTAVSASTRTRVGGVFAELGPPAVARRGAVFRGVLTSRGIEGIFIGTPARTGVLAATGDAVGGTRLRSVEDPIAVNDDVYFLARLAGSVSSMGLYRVRAQTIPRRKDPPLPIEPVLVPGDAMPAPVGGVVVAVTAPRVGPGGDLTVVVEAGGGSAPSALLRIDPALP